MGKLIGTGAYSQVKMAEDVLKKEAVAIKIIKKNELDDYERENVYLEIDALKQLKMFDHILELKDVVEEGNHIFIVTEWLSMDSYDYINW